MPITSSFDPPRPWERAALLAGVGFMAAQLAAIAYFIVTLVPHLPPLSAPVADHAAFYTEYADANALMAYLTVLPVPLFLFFLGGLFVSLRRAEGGIGVLTVTGIGAGIALSTLWPIGIVIAHAGQSMAQSGLDPATVLAFDGVAQLLLALSALPRAVLLVATSMLLSQARLAPRAVAWTGYALALIAFASPLTLVSADAFPLTAIGSLLFAVWIAVLGGVLVRRLAPSLSPRTAVLAAS